MNMIRNSAEVQRRKIKRGHTENKGKERKRRNLIFLLGIHLCLSCCVRACHTKYNVITNYPLRQRKVETDLLTFEGAVEMFVNHQLKVHIRRWKLFWSLRVTTMQKTTRLSSTHMLGTILHDTRYLPVNQYLLQIEGQ